MTEDERLKMAIDENTKLLNDVAKERERAAFLRGYRTALLAIRNEISTRLEGEYQGGLP